MLWFPSDFMDRPLAYSLGYVNEMQSYKLHIIIYNYYKFKTLTMYYATSFYNRLLIETVLQTMNDQLYLNVFLSTISFIIFLDLIFMLSSACFMTFSLLHVYLQRISTLSLHTCSCILTTFYTVCRFDFYKFNNNVCLCM